MSGELFRDVHSPRLRDLAGDAIVSDPVRCTEAAQVVMPFTAQDREQLMWEAREESLDAFPVHFSLVDGYTVRACCLHGGTCDVAREAFVVAYVDQMERAQLLADLLDERVPLNEHELHDIDLEVDPITVMAADHIRINKPNRTRSHR